MRLERNLVTDQQVYDIMYFSPVHVGEERSTTLLYFQTEIYHRIWPVSMVDKITKQIDTLKKVELSILPLDSGFKSRHREAVLCHCKMALAYLDSREARIAMKLCQVAESATTSTEHRISQDPEADFDFLRVTLLSVMACAARRVKFFQKAVEALSEAKDICIRAGNDPSTGVHPLMTALTFLNLSAVLGDIDHDEQGLRWGLEALSMMYNLFSNGQYPEVLEKYFVALACHNSALLNVKLGLWDAAVELVNEGIELTKALHDVDDGLRNQLIAIGAQAKHVPEGFLLEAVNALNGWGDESGVWNLSFWDFSVGEIKEEIHVLKRTKTLRHLIIEHFDDDRRYPAEVEDALLVQFVLAVVSCQPLELLTVSNLDFDPRKVWRKIKKRSFLETSWYASALNFTNILESASKPEIGDYVGFIKDLNVFSKKVVMCLIVLGNECEGIDLSENNIDARSITALVRALRTRNRPKFTRQVNTAILRDNALDLDTMRVLAQTWEGDVVENQKEFDELDSPEVTPVGDLVKKVSLDSGLDPMQAGVSHVDVSLNRLIGDEGFDTLCSGIALFQPFQVLRADTIGIGAAGCMALHKLAGTHLELLNLSNNAIGSEGASIVCKAAWETIHLHTLELDSCSIDQEAAKHFADLLSHHGALRNISLNQNNLGSEGVIEFCEGAGKSVCLKSVHLAYNNTETEEAAEAIGLMMRRCSTLLEMNLSGNHFDGLGVPHIGGAIEHSHVLTMFLEDMGFTDMTIDEFLDHGSAETQDLQVMILNNNPIGDEGLGIIAECLSIGLTDLSLSKCGLTGKSQSTLLNLVSLSPNLRSLDLSQNVLGPNGCSDMVSWMTQNEKENFSLRSLELGDCNLGDEGFFQLVPVLGSLTYLGVRSNNITSAGLEAVMNSHKMIQLKCLDLANNHVGEQGVHALTERFQQEHKRSLWNPKQLTSTIDTVILTDNDIGPGLSASTEAFLKIHNPLLTVVW